MKPGNLNEDARGLIAAGRAGHPAPDLVRARVRRSVASKLLSGGVAVSVVHASSLLAAGGAKLGVALAVAGTLGAGAWYGLSESASHTTASAVQAPSAQEGRKIASVSEQQSPANARQLPAERRVTSEATPPAVAGAPLAQEASKTALRAARAEANAQASQAAREKPPESAKVAGGLSEEVALLSDAGAKLNHGDAQGAARLLREYDRQFKAKVLIQERVATGVLVECALGNVDGARRAALRFHKNWPRSPLARRIAGSCAGDAAKR